jgi:hypothetical protein
MQEGKIFLPIVKQKRRLTTIHTFLKGSSSFERTDYIITKGRKIRIRNDYIKKELKRLLFRSESNNHNNWFAFKKF